MVFKVFCMVFEAMFMVFEAFLASLEARRVLMIDPFDHEARRF